MLLQVNWNRYNTYDLSAMYPWKAIQKDGTQNVEPMKYPFRDSLRVEYAHAHIWKKLVLNGDLPLWNPYYYSGVPFLAMGNFPVFAPQNILFLLFPLQKAFALIDWLQILIAGFLMYGFLRYLKLSNFAALLGSIVYMGNSNFFLSDQVLISVGSLIWIPGVFMAVEIYIQKRSFHTALIITLFVALQFLNGNLETIVYTFILLVPYILYRTWSLSESAATRIKLAWLCFLMVTAGALLTSFLWIPIMELGEQSSRMAMVPGDYVRAFEPFRIFTILLPNFFGENTFEGVYMLKWGNNIYLGSTVLLLVLLAFFGMNMEYKTLSYFKVGSIVSLAWTMSNPVYSYIFSHIPVFNQIQSPDRMISIFFFCISVIAGFGMQKIIDIYCHEN